MYAVHVRHENPKSCRRRFVVELGERNFAVILAQLNVVVSGKNDCESVLVWLTHPLEGIGLC